MKDIKDEGLVVDLNIGVSLDDAKVDEPVLGSLFIQMSGEDVLISGTVRCKMTLTCSRCLTEFGNSMELGVDLTYIPLREEEYEEKGLQTADLDIGFYAGGEIDLQLLVKEQIMLNMPMRVVCSQECKGLCTTCGVNLNEGQCQCMTGGGDLNEENRLINYLDKLRAKYKVN
ncbi:MAG: DUF177 domain-containing protein [Nitrospirae bacterium]|nr:DUF177 domain-containing protein [Nitrospirota bacterium]